MTLLDLEQTSSLRLPREKARPFGPSLNGVLPLTIALMALAITSRAGMIAWPFLNDSGLYAQMGRTVAGGGVLYRDFYETKLPGAALLASVFWRAFGPHWAGYVLCQLALALLASMALVRATRRHIGVASTVPVFLFAIVFLDLSQLVYTGFQLETLQAFFEAIAAMAAMSSFRKDDSLATFTTGLAAGMAAMAKPGGLAVAAAYGVTLILFGRRRLLHGFILLIGIAIPTAVTAIYAIKTGAWQYLPGVVRDIAAYASGTPINADALLKLFVVLLVFGWPFAARITGNRSAHGKTPKVQRFVILWLLLDLLAVLMQRRLYPYHFLPLACPLALLYGMMPGRPGSRSIAVGLLPIALLSLTWEGSSPLHLNRRSAPLPITAYIASHTTANDSVFADQIGRLLIETDRQPGSRLGTFFYLVNADDSPKKYIDILLGDFEFRKPKYLVLPRGWDQELPGLASCDILQHRPQRRANFITAWASLRRYVGQRYHLEYSADKDLIYRRNYTAADIMSRARRVVPE